MDVVIRAVFVYLFVLAIVRISGKRTLAQITPFDLVLLLIISESVQSALVGDDASMANGVVLVTTLVLMDIAMSLVKRQSRRAERLLDGAPLVIVENGRLLEDRMQQSRVDAGDVLEAARDRQGLKSLDDIAYAVLERSGHITVVPKAQ